jgi:hypothetical protein
MPALSGRLVYWQISRASASPPTSLLPAFAAFQSHYIFYTQEPDHVLIRVLIHVRQDLRPALFE